MAKLDQYRQYIQTVIRRHGSLPRPAYPCRARLRSSGPTRGPLQIRVGLNAGEVVVRASVFASQCSGVYAARVWRN